jgi:D-alanyl-D-alanine carboxypeptidase
MTATVVLEIVEEMEVRCTFARLQSQVLILPSAADLLGTSAQLLKEDMLTVEELLYGMMLPSGNDAAESLALYFGSLLLT